MSCVNSRAGVVSWRADSSGHLTDLGAGWDDICLVPRSDMLGGHRWARCLVSSEESARVFDLWMQAVESGKDYRCACWIRGRNGPLLIRVRAKAVKIGEIIVGWFGELEAVPEHPLRAITDSMYTNRVVTKAPTRGGTSLGLGLEEPHFPAGASVAMLTDRIYGVKLRQTGEILEIRLDRSEARSYSRTANRLIGPTVIVRERPKRPSGGQLRAQSP